MDPPPFSMYPPPSIPPPPIIPVIPTTTTTTTVYAANPTTTTPAFVANPTPTAPASFNHPSYSEMIYEAIGALKERDGSSKRAIAKYIEGAYKNLPPTHSALLTHHLKRLKNNGNLVMVKKSYKLPRSDNHLPEVSAADAAAVPVPAPDAAGPKKGRGRPPKTKLTPTAAAEQISQTVVVGSGQADAGGSNVQLQPATEVVKRTPGRPKKNGSVAAATERGLKKARGRPLKSATTGAKKNTGKPRKLKSIGVSTVVTQNGVKRKRGRPPKAQAVVQPQAQPIVVPYANDTTNNVGVPNTPRSRGRPPKIGALPTAVGGAVSGKRRGRPPKVAGVSKPMKPKKSTGRPVGRPKKTTEVPVQQTSLAAAYGDLQRKLEYFQSKVKQAVGVLKPQFSGESNISAVAVIQELEGLAAMDISVPFREEA